MNAKNRRNDRPFSLLFQVNKSDIPREEVLKNYISFKPLLLGTMMPLIVARKQVFTATFLPKAVRCQETIQVM